MTVLCVAIPRCSTGAERYTYMEARFYDAQVGRFLSTDPVDDDFNIYAYVRNDPLNRTDPSGLFNDAALLEALVKGTARI